MLFVSKVLRAHVLRQEDGNVFRPETASDQSVDALLGFRAGTINSKHCCIFSSHGFFPSGISCLHWAIGSPMGRSSHSAWLPDRDCLESKQAVKALAERAAQQGLQLFAKVPAVGRGQMSFERLPRLPDFVDREVIRVPVLLKNFEADDAGILAAVGGKLADEFGGLIENLASAGDVHVRNGI